LYFNKDVEKIILSYLIIFIGTLNKKNNFFYLNISINPQKLDLLIFINLFITFNKLYKKINSKTKLLQTFSFFSLNQIIKQLNYFIIPSIIMKKLIYLKKFSKIKFIYHIFIYFFLLNSKVNNHKIIFYSKDKNLVEFIHQILTVKFFLKGYLQKNKNTYKYSIFQTRDFIKLLFIYYNLSKLFIDNHRLIKLKNILILNYIKHFKLDTNVNFKNLYLKLI
jgi:hypothetical protein